MTLKVGMIVFLASQKAWTVVTVFGKRHGQDAAGLVSLSGHILSVPTLVSPAG